MKVSFDIDKNKTPYHVKPYKIPVAQINLMKRSINKTVRKALSKYSGNSPWVTPIFEVLK